VRWAGQLHGQQRLRVRGGLRRADLLWRQRLHWRDLLRRRQRHGHDGRPASAPDVGERDDWQLRELGGCAPFALRSDSVGGTWLGFPSEDFFEFPSFSFLGEITGVLWEGIGDNEVMISLSRSSTCGLD
jgi:hypothetical protein